MLDTSLVGFNLNSNLCAHFCLRIRESILGFILCLKQYIKCHQPIQENVLQKY